MNLRLLDRADWQRLVNYVRSLPWERDGKRIAYRVSIDEQKSKRSAEQNARLWALYTAISQQAPAHMGGEYHAPDVWHTYLAGRFLGMEPGPYGTGVRKSTARLTVGEFSDYMTQIEAWAAEQFEGFDFEWREAA